MPEMIPVVSTSVRRVGYAADARELHVQFQSSSTIYVYEGVPRAMYDELLAAPSIGTFVNQQIKGAYTYRAE